MIKSLYALRHQVAADITQKLGHRSPAASPGARLYAQELKREWATPGDDASWRQLLLAVRGCDILLFGDFHVDIYTQTLFIRLLTETQALAATAGDSVILLECFTVNDQPALASYLQGGLSEDEFFRATQFRVRWPFPRDGYALILAFAKAQRIPVYGINPEGSFLDDAFREQKLAHHIVAVQQQHPQKKLYCLVGENHLASRHLPKSLAIATNHAAPATMVRIFVNVDAECAPLVKKYHVTKRITARHGPAYSLRFKPSWYRDLNYLLWLDCQPGSGSEQGALTPLVEDYFFRFAQMIAAFFELRISRQNLANFAIHISGSLAAGPSPSPLAISWPLFDWDQLFFSIGTFLYSHAQPRYRDLTGDTAKHFRDIVGWGTAKIMNPYVEFMRFKPQRLIGEPLGAIPDDLTESLYMNRSEQNFFVFLKNLYRLPQTAFDWKYWR